MTSKKIWLTYFFASITSAKFTGILFHIDRSSKNHSVFPRLIFLCITHPRLWIRTKTKSQFFMLTPFWIHLHHKKWKVIKKSQNSRYKSRFFFIFLLVDGRIRSWIRTNKLCIRIQEVRKHPDPKHWFNVSSYRIQFPTVLQIQIRDPVLFDLWIRESG